MKKLLITGANGFLGKAVVKQLINSELYEIYAVISGRNKVELPCGVKVIEANLLNRSASKKLICDIKPDIMLHLAWELSFSGYTNSVNNLIWFEESLFMLRTFIENGGFYFAFAGSSAEYPRLTGETEINSVSCLSLYGESKNSFHNLAKTYCDSMNISYLNLRYFPMLGDGINANTSAIAKAISTLNNDEQFICKSPNNIWDFIDIEDAAIATTKILEKKYCGAVNIASGIPYKMDEVFRLIANKMNREHLLCFDYENTSKEILVANTNILNNEIGFKCSINFEKTIDDVIFSITKRSI